MKNNDYSIKACSKIVRKDGLKMRFVKEYTFKDFVEGIAARYRDLECMSVFKQESSSITYKKFAFKIHSISQYLVNLGLKKGDRVIIFGDSTPQWIQFYLGLTTIGCIAVPIMPTFSTAEANYVIDNSEAIGIFAQKNQFKLVREYALEKKLHIFRGEDLFHIPNELFTSDAKFEDLPGKDITHTKFYLNALREMDVQEDDIASILYTSGTTGAAKGVVLTHKNILRNAERSTTEFVKLNPGERALSILPMSHIYEFSIGQILMLFSGINITFLGKPPTVNLLLPALKMVRPHFVLSVPLLIEKVYKGAVLPVISESGKLGKYYKNPLLKPIIASIIGNKLKQTFGGKLKFFGLGGAPLDKEIEKFLYLSGFPYAQGYGLTETSPLLAGCGPRKKDHKLGYIGNVFPDVDMKIIDKDDKGVGEIVVKGPSVMSGYYKNDAINKESFTQDGYFRTGDLGFIKNGKLALCGRSKSVIIGPSGENIYPESLESLINNMDFVEESLVVPEGNTLLALVKLDLEKMSEKLKISLEEAKVEAKNYVEKIRKSVNDQVSSANKLSSAELRNEPFERTSSQKIKRFLYNKDK